jgi:hypothetical protein
MLPVCRDIGYIRGGPEMQGRTELIEVFWIDIRGTLYRICDTHP